MSVSQISSNAANALVKTLARTTVQSGSTNGAADATATGASPKISKLGETMRQLESLATSDPAKFKEVTAEIGSRLNELSSTLSGDEASRVSELASKFMKASETGDASALRPDKAPSGGAPPKGPPPKGPPPKGPPPQAAGPQAAQAYEKSQALSTEGNDVRQQIDQILSNAMSSFT
ncbi:MAG: hypothetical protein QM784_11270 [Polyangiaceae bacterium]